ncbi:hypothetical protein [Micromonospora sp. DT47]
MEILNSTVDRSARVSEAAAEALQHIQLNTVINAGQVSNAFRGWA